MSCVFIDVYTSLFDTVFVLCMWSKWMRRPTLSVFYLSFLPISFWDLWGGSNIYSIQFLKYYINPRSHRPAIAIVNGFPYGRPRAFMGDSLINLWPELAAASGASLWSSRSVLCCAPHCGHLTIRDAMLFDAQLMHVRCGCNVFQCTFDARLSSAHWGHDVHRELSVVMWSLPPKRPRCVTTAQYSRHVGHNGGYKRTRVANAMLLVYMRALFLNVHGMQVCWLVVMTLGLQKTRFEFCFDHGYILWFALVDLVGPPGCWEALCYPLSFSWRCPWLLVCYRIEAGTIGLYTKGNGVYGFVR